MLPRNSINLKKSLKYHLCNKTQTWEKREEEYSAPYFGYFLLPSYFCPYSQEIFYKFLVSQEILTLQNNGF